MRPEQLRATLDGVREGRRADDEEVLARAPKDTLRWQLWTNAALAVMWSALALAGGTSFARIFAVAYVLLASVTFVVSRREGHVVLLADHRRRLVVRTTWGRERQARRDEVRAVHGDVPGRPTWSQEVVVDLGVRELRLPVLDRKPGDLVAELQDWAGVGERPDPVPTTRTRSEPGTARASADESR